MYDNGIGQTSLLHVCTGETSIYTTSCYREIVSTLHCVLENGSNLHVNEHQKIQNCCTRSTEERRRKKNVKLRYFTLRGAFVNCTIIAML